MTKYIYSECPTDFWPEIKTIMANSYHDAVERLIQKYVIEFNDEDRDQYLDTIETMEDLQEYLNDRGLVISDLVDIEEL